MKACVNCGDPVRGTGTLCTDCRPAPPPAAGPLCPHCRGDVTWENIERTLRRRADGVVDVLYSCPGCGSTLESASWIEEPPQGR